MKKAVSLLMSLVFCAVASETGDVTIKTGNTNAMNIAGGSGAEANQNVASVSAKNGSKTGDITIKTGNTNAMNIAAGAGAKANQNVASVDVK